eukprot:355192-Chlamydomonas_euryale.AAC.1
MLTCGPAPDPPTLHTCTSGAFSVAGAAPELPLPPPRLPRVALGLDSKPPKCPSDDQKPDLLLSTSSTIVSPLFRRGRAAAATRTYNSCATGSGRGGVGRFIGLAPLLLDTMLDTMRTTFRST